MAVLQGLKPQDVFYWFEKLCSVPHGSGNTKIISDLCVDFARERGLKYRQEPCNNVIIWKDGTAGYENAAPVILQGHIDMVCAKTDDCTKDMAVEGLDLVTDGEWVWADKTSLGGDNCIAVAMIMAILDDDTLAHPPLEAVFTVDEEVGLEGAFALDCSDLKGRKLLNLDSELEGVVTVSCAGGMRADCLLPAALVEAADMSGYRLTVAGLHGGHSGGDIHRGRASANQVMARTLYTALERIPTLRLASMDGGQFDNVICSRCDASIAVPKGSEGELEDCIRQFEAALQNEYEVTDGGLTLTCVPAEVKTAFSGDDTRRVLRALLAMPQGVETMDTDFEGLVQTSLNMGVTHLDGEGLHVTFSIRSSIASRKEMLAQRVRAITELAGGSVTYRGVYPGWQYRRQSDFRDTVMAVYKDITGKDGTIEATHGGLECGLLIEKLPGLDAVSIGPDLFHVHSVRERLSVPSTERVYALVCEVLKRSRR